MQERLEELIQAIYQDWKSILLKAQEAHPDEETLACFKDGRLSKEDCEGLKKHLISCDACLKALIMQANLETGEEKEVPQALIEQAKNLMDKEDGFIFEIVLRLKAKALELLNTTGAVRVGQELMPAPILRSRSIKDFKDEINILKDFQDVRVEARIENKGGGAFSLTVTIKEKQTQKTLKDLRVTLIKDELELESYLASSGSASFEHVLIGKYTVAIANLEEKLATILLDIKV